MPSTASAVIDLRSDTVTRPTAAMREAMSTAVVGDDVLGDDPTVIRLQERVAAMMGKDAACFVPSGTMANQLAIRAQCEAGDEVVCHPDSHIIHYETGAPAAISGVMIRPVDGNRGIFGAAEFERQIRPDSIHAPASRMVVIENTHNRGGGSIWPIEQVRAVSEIARARGLRVHLDGARIWNACVKTGLSPAAYARHADTISCCFSKGLGAPVGSAVVGSRDVIARVVRFRKMLGGAMRQSGVLAAAAIHALDHHIDRLADDHANAARLASGLSDVPGLTVDLDSVVTNMCYFDVDPEIGSASDLVARLAHDGVLVLATAPQRIRAVLHLDVTRSQVDDAVRRIAMSAGVVKSV